MDGNLAYQEEMREERIAGSIVMMSSPSLNHIFISGNIYRIFGNHLANGPCTAIPDGATLYLDSDNEFKPDMMVVCDPGKLGPDGVYGAPDLVVEVLSPSTARNDKGIKKDAYEACGVREYWIVSPGDRSIDQYLLRDGKLVLENTYSLIPDWMRTHMSQAEREAAVTEFRCSLYEDLVIRLEDVFARVQ